MADEAAPQSFFDSIGLESAEDKIARRRRQLAEERADRNYRNRSGMGQRERVYYDRDEQFGHNARTLVNRLKHGNKDGPLKTSEQQKADIFRKANAAAMAHAAEAEERGIYLSADEHVQSQENFAMKEAQKVGDYETIALISEHQNKRKQERTTAALNLTKLRGEVEHKDAQTHRIYNPLEGADRGTITNVFSKDAPYGDTGQNAYIDPNTLHALNRPGGDIVYPQGKYTTKAPVKPILDKDGNETRLTLKQKGWSVQEIGGIRSTAKAYFSALEASRDADHILRRAQGIMTTPDGNPTIFSAPGKMQHGLQTVMDAVTGFRTMLGWDALDGDMIVHADGDESDTFVLNGRMGSSGLTDRFGWSDEDIYEGAEAWGVSPGQIQLMRENADIRAEWNAMLIQMTYTMMRAKEPLAKQFSDNDFKTAFKGSGGTATNIRQFRAIYFNNLRDAERRYSSEVMMLPAGYEDLGGSLTNINKLLPGLVKEVELLYGRSIIRGEEPIDQQGGGAGDDEQRENYLSLQEDLRQESGQ